MLEERSEGMALFVCLKHPRERFSLFQSHYRSIIHSNVRNVDEIPVELISPPSSASNTVMSALLIYIISLFGQNFRFVSRALDYATAELAGHHMPAVTA